MSAISCPPPKTNGGSMGPLLSAIRLRARVLVGGLKGDKSAVAFEREGGNSSLEVRRAHL